MFHSLSAPEPHCPLDSSRRVRLSIHTEPVSNKLNFARTTPRWSTSRAVGDESGQGPKPVRLRPSSSINLSYCSLSVASFIAAKHIALARAHHPRQPNPHSVCGSSLAQSTRGFVLWRLPDAGPGARRSISHGRHPKPCTGADICSAANLRRSPQPF